ncbi:DUF4124 domain-containing protein [Fontimonas sp. SYSU GA230001]|uniref:DUF4124 domain-containing protein n=1 Tax=Fontimonas sp. SYSU GA230001 TaxID=3142450 RepID=UPI0032B333E9
MRWCLLAVLLVASAAVPAADEIYREVGPDGTVRYTDRPPHPRARPVLLPPLSGVTPGPARRAFYSAEALRAAARFAVSVESPTPGQVLRAGVDRLVAAANVMPGLVAGFRLIYLLDGRAITEAAIDALSLPLPDPGVGEHRLVVVVVDPAGREVARSPETVFAVMAP